jgi:hypothetical protein
MHLAYATCVPPGEVPLDERALLGDLAVPLLTDGAGEPPPQPATNNPSVISVLMAAHRIPRRAVRHGLLRCRFGLLAGFLSMSMPGHR